MWESLYNKNKSLLHIQLNEVRYFLCSLDGI